MAYFSCLSEVQQPGLPGRVLLLIVPVLCCLIPRVAREHLLCSLWDRALLGQVLAGAHVLV